ncbi:glutathione ABC transporter substrate-binding protein [Salinicoccus sesuvii]|uniref:Glutathione ABC transporter substrate-binding protein n=1 Tax=Salinicoccus sesuvii TaxID=868281 RepID=A0ABV7N434_9STAP
MTQSWRIILIGVMLVVLSACTNDGDVTEGIEGNSEGDETATEGDITLAFPTDIVSMDAHGSNDTPSEQLRNTLYEGLVTQDENLEITPVLATEWEQIDDVTWEFTLREDVTFHDGSTFNAEVVEANLDRLQDAAVASPRNFVLNMIEEVNVVDDYTVELITEYPFAPLLNNLTHGAGKMMSKELIDSDYQNALDEAGIDMTLDEYKEAREDGGQEYEDASENISEYVGTLIEQGPIGTNYMKFDSRSPGESTRIVANEEYWDGPPSLSSATYKAVSETGSRIAEIETGASNFIQRVESSNIDRIENNPDVTLTRTDALAIDFIGFNTEKAPFDDVRVRQAVTLAFDNQAVFEGVFNNSGTPAVAALAPNTLGYDENLEPLGYDMDRAKTLLTEAGYEDGFDMTLMVNEDNPERLNMSIWLQESLEELSINVNIRQIEWGTYLEMTGNGEHDMFVMGWSNSTADPEELLTTLFHSDMVGAQGNRSFFKNDDFDQLLDEGRREFDTDAREQIYMDAQELLVEEAPAIFVRHSEYLNAYHNSIDNLEIGWDDLYDMRNVEVE